MLPIYSNALNNMAALYHQNGNYRLAIKNYNQSIDLTPPKKEFEDLLAISYHNIGKCFQDQGDFNNALRYLAIKRLKNAPYQTKDSLVLHQILEKFLYKAVALVLTLHYRLYFATEKK